MRNPTVRSFDTAQTFGTGWREPAAPRYQPTPVADSEPMPSLMEELRRLPRIVYAVGGGVFAAIMGAMLGGAMHI
ncbi:hypothetical protein [Brevundimonas sp. Leaf363]|uniref:hypothetical protein n=1 Tax=Brevundimonas sp. Leaf363 TaxID=1736353 RepID=UPI000B259FB8|nr:hypothetical protein [Brevundimonas sp. Leaf363]